jgi:hypothetical protein
MTGGDPYRDSGYIRAANEHFSVSFNFSNFLQSNIDKGGIGVAREFRRRATANNQILYIHPGFMPVEDRETWLKNVRNEEVRPLMEKRIRVLLEFVEKVDTGVKPTFINFINEAFFYNNDSNAGVVSPYRDVFGDKFVSETYLMFHRAAKEMGLQIGKDLRMIVSDSDIQKPGGKSDFVLKELLKGKREVAANLGIPEQDVQLDVAPHFYQPLDGRLNWYRRPLPTKDEIIDNFKRFSQVGRVHVTELSVLGTKNQAEINQGLVRVMTAAVQSGVCDSINIWLALRTKPTPDQQADTFFNQLGLFDNDYNPTDNYRALLRALMELPAKK